MGSYGVGTRNRNGDCLIDFLSVNGHFTCNTAFQHPCRHRTTWTGFIKDQKKANRIRLVYTQIEYILCPKRANPLLRDSPAYAGTGLNSDHKLVITRHAYGYPPSSTSGKRPIKINIEQLSRNKTTQRTTKNPYKTLSPNKMTVMIQTMHALTYLLHSMKTSAVNTAGKNQGRQTKFLESENDLLIEELFNQQEALRLHIYQHNNSENRSSLRRKRNNILRKISKRLKEIAIENANALTDEITSTDDCRKMFRAAKRLKVMKLTHPVMVRDAESNFIGTDQGKAEATKA